MTTQTAERLTNVEAAIQTLLSELGTLRLTGLAALLLDLMTQEHPPERLIVSTTQQLVPHMFPAADERRVLHVSVRALPADQLLDIPMGSVPARVIGEGRFEFVRDTPRTQELLKVYDDHVALAVTMLAEDMDSSFSRPFNVAETEAVL